MIEDLNVALADVSDNREEVINKLMKYAATDMLLFWGQDKDLMLQQEKLWRPILQWAQKTLNTEFNITCSLDVPDQDKTSGQRLRCFMESLSDRELLAFFKASLNMRSILLAAALVKGQISAQEAFEAAYVEELWQSENWGVVEEAQEKREELKQELVEIENFLKN